MSDNYELGLFQSRSNNSQDCYRLFVDFLPTAYQEINTATNLGELLGFLLNGVREIVRADLVEITLWDQSVAQLVLTFPKWPGIIYNAPSENNHIASTVTSDNTIQVVSLPVAVNGLAIAQIIFNKKLPNSWCDTEYTVIRKLNGLISLAISHVRMHYQVRQAQAQYQANLQRIAKMEAALQKVRSFAHDMSQPLTTLQLELELLPPPAEPADQEVLTQLKESVINLTMSLRECRAVVIEAMQV